MHGLKLIALGLVLVAIATIGVANVVSFKSSEPSAAQDIRSMENRLNLMEQRLYTMQTSIQRLEQSASIQRSVTSDTGSREVNLLGEEVRNVRERLGEVECAVLKLDERTGTKRAKPSEPCRANPTAPINLPARP
jgi:hypothetical protein